MISSTAAPYPAAVSTIQALGAVTEVKTVGTPSPNPPSIVLREFERDLDAYLAGVSGGAGSLEEIIDYNEANPVEGLSTSSASWSRRRGADLSTYEADRDAGLGVEPRR